ncbi:hypothetical protein [Mucilaginibacter gotjawali]|uniref:Uncharacterized protein n=2 Tax=Mucilaginibacter gotjawali TaxID=1550579 RepID=A0A110AZZ2_9SPHI|nr:hypothetical protein [Mucilaginibacter gotjawali]MBB3058861.1 hypothetical protein [Mucilaginibacter gotjawali]BAU52170.1 hypothetical protein MgSA37_00320 [Mucilaginibacter gotjawali]
MIEFNKSVKKVLPYNRRLYLQFWDDDCDLPTEWNGVSIQLPGAYQGKVPGLTAFVDAYEGLFKNVVLKLDNGSSWTVNHDDKDLNWFPNDEDNLTALRALFKQNNIPKAFRGALIFTNDDLLKFSRDLISYPSAIFNKEGVYYKNLDISHGELSFIMKIYGRSSIDLLSINKELLREVINENSTSLFIVKEFRGSSL